MSIFFTLLPKLLLLYSLIWLGYIAGRYLGVMRSSIATLLIYIIAPAAFFLNIWKTPFLNEYFFLPLIFFGVGAFLCFLMYGISRWFFTDATRNILAFTAGTGNTGYFGIPLVALVLGEEIAGIVMMATFGLIFFENTIGFFMVAKGRHTIVEAVRRLFCLPTLYAVIIAILLHFGDVQMPEMFFDFRQYFLGTFSVLGMMIIGFGLSTVTKKNGDPYFISLAFMAKFIFWPALIIGIITLDQLFFQVFPEKIHQMMIILSLTPLAANTVTFAVELDTHPEKAAVAVALSTLFSLFFIPVVLSFFL